MQLPHVFIAFLAREVRFPHGFIAFLLFVFLGVPRWLPRAIFIDFGNLLGALGLSWAVLGCLLGLLGVLVATLLGFLEATKEPSGSHF